MHMRGKSPALLATIATRRQPNRPFGGNMHRLWRKLAQQLLYPFTGSPGQAYFRVAGQWVSAKSVRRYDQYFMTACLQRLDHLYVDPYHTIDLRMPGIGS